MLVQAWHGILPQHGSAVDGSVCTDRSNWRVQAKMKMAGDKTATVDSSTICHFWSFPASHHCCHTKCALLASQALGEQQGQSPQRGRAGGQELMFDSAWRQSGYAVIPAHDRRKREEGKLCQSFIMDKEKAGSPVRFERTLINRADRWPPVAPHPYENPFPFLVCQSLSPYRAGESLCSSQKV